MKIAISYPPIVNSLGQKAMVSQNRNVQYFKKPTYLLPIWDLAGIALGFSTALLGRKTAMLCTASVEEVIEDHYQNQLKKIGDDEKELKEKIEKFRGDEVNHKNIAYDSGATNTGVYSVMDKIIQTGSRIAITISEKI